MSINWFVTSSPSCLNDGPLSFHLDRRVCEGLNEVHSGVKVENVQMYILIHGYGSGVSKRTHRTEHHVHWWLQKSSPIGVSTGPSPSQALILAIDPHPSPCPLLLLSFSSPPSPRQAPSHAHLPLEVVLPLFQPKHLMFAAWS